MCAKVSGDSIIKDSSCLSHNILRNHAPVFSPAIVHGQKCEEKACKLVLQKLQCTHTNMVLTSCGSFICHDVPYVSANPDRILHWACCGKSVLEVKNPYTGQSLSIADYDASKSSCLVQRDSSSRTIEKSQVLFSSSMSTVMYWL